MLRSERDAQNRLAQFLMDDMPVASCVAVSVQLSADWYAKFRAARIAFLKSLDDSISELAMLNLSRDDFMNLLSGRHIPANLSVKFARPILYGGEIEPGNMFLLQTFPFGHNLDIFMAEQSGAAEIWYPAPKKKIYVFKDVLSGGPGGNATADRLAQGFAQMANDRNA